MKRVATRITIISVFCLNIWSSIFTFASNPLTTFDLCGVNDMIITKENVSLSLNFSAEQAVKTGGQCGLVIIFKSKRVSLTIEELRVARGAVFEIQEGPGVTSGEKIEPKDGNQLPSSYVSSSNAMYIRFKDASQGQNGPSIFRGKISSAAFQDMCHCREVRNGTLECFQTTVAKKCEVKCDPSFMELTMKKQILTCDLKNGTWDIDTHSGPLECKKVRKPLKIKSTVNFNYANLTCKQVDIQKVEGIFRAVLKNNSNVQSKGVCFGQRADDNLDCKDSVKANCSMRGSVAEITVTVLDRIVEPSTLEEANSKLQELNRAYNTLKFKDVLDVEALMMKKGNDSRAISKESMVTIVTPWCNGGNDYIKVPGNATIFVCSTCPRHHLYNVTTRACQKCPSGSIALQEARSCSHQNDTLIMTPTRVLCDNKCMKGKRLDDKSGMCEWCPRNKYQNSSSKINPDCVSCPGDKMTIFPGAQEVSDCRYPCPLGTFMNYSSGTCQECPTGTYMDVDKHVSTRCKACVTGKTTQGVGSKAINDCYQCSKGQFYNTTALTCTSCPMGQYQDEVNKGSCKDCANGAVTLKVGSKTSSDCVKVCGLGKFLKNSNCFDCPKNTYQDMVQHRATECKPCGPNEITNATGSKAMSDCQQCSKGQFYNSTAMTCTSCPMGKYQDEVNKGSCKDCANGTVTLKVGSKTSSDCVKVCGLGKFLKHSNCFDCPKNTYQDMVQHRATECKPCGPNEITNATGKSDVSDCFVGCEEGRFLDGSQCTKCPKGQYQDQPGQVECKQCPDGTLTLSEGQKNVSSCTKVCRKGQLYVTSIKTCKPCPYGTYQEADIHQLESCQMCRSNKTSVKEGAEYSKQCVAPDGEESGVVVKMSVKFTSLHWSDELKDKKSAKYQEIKMKIEDAIKYELRKDPSFEGVTVTALMKGSVIAEFQLHFNDKLDNVPGKALQVAARSGKIENLSVSSDSLKILQQDCSQPLGMESGKIKNEQITASSFFKHYEPYEGRLNLKGERGWYPEYNRNIEYLQIDFTKEINITAVATQGKSKANLYVKEYKLSLSKDGQNWKEYTESGKTKVFSGNYDSDTVVRNKLAHTVTYRFIRFLPQSWSEDIFMRVEVYGCLPNALLPSVAAKSRGKDDKWPWGAYLGIAFAVLLVVGIVAAVICWKKKSKEKKNADAETDQALMGMSSYGDGEYRIIEKNAAEPEDENDENVV